jgi:hypothetical protein
MNQLSREEFLELANELVSFDYNSNLQDNGNKIKFKFFTETNDYTIVADFENNYLGCVAGTRKPLAGETHFRGSDLPDGKCTKNTWEKIINGVVRYELVPLGHR